jgi:hypothetical protein
MLGERMKGRCGFFTAARLEEAKTGLGNLAHVYLVTDVARQSQATLDAKRRDLQRFLSFYQKLCGHDRPDEWFVSVTKDFLKTLQQERLAAGVDRAHLRYRAPFCPLVRPQVPGAVSPGLPH